MYLRFIVVLTTLFSAISFWGQNSIEISGVVKFFEPEFRIVAYQRTGSLKDTLASVPVKPDGSYSMLLEKKDPGVVTLSCAQWQSVNFWAGDENLEIDFRGLDTARIKIKNPPFVYIKGGKNNELMNWINFESYRNYQHMIAVSQAAYRAKFESDDSKQTLSFSLYDAGSENFNEHLRYLLKHYASRPAVMAAVALLDSDRDSLLIREALSELAEKQPQMKPCIRDYYARVDSVRILKNRMAIGNKLPSFTCVEQNMKPLDLSEFSGKVLVLDFWASWCGPCRQEIPNMKRCYDAFHKRGVEFLSVSIDAKKGDWEKALRTEQMPWKQAWVQDAGKAVMQTMQFGGIPYILIIDTQGRIYSKGVRGKQLEKTLEQILQGQQPESKPVQSVKMGMMM